jgi:RNA methyltransferase, TrmH family
MSATHVERITSADNSLVKSVRKAVLKGGATDNGLIVAEGVHMLEEARRSMVKVEAVVCTESKSQHIGNIDGRVVVVPDALFSQISETRSPQGVITLVRLLEPDPEQMFGPGALVVITDAIQDPGNLGTILRSAEAFGATGVYTLPGTVDFANPKVVRAAAGSLFRVPIIRGLMEGLRRPEIQFYAADGAARPTIADIAWNEPLALVIGNEGNGVSEGFRRKAKGVRIPTVQVESLNAAMAATILLYEASRQRGTATGV